jgi:hypothetical protein
MTPVLKSDLSFDGVVTNVEVHKDALIISISSLSLTLKSFTWTETSCFIGAGVDVLSRAGMETASINWKSSPVGRVTCALS